MDLSNRRLRIRNEVQRAADMVRRLYLGLDPDVRYALDRRAFNAQRSHRHPATLSASRRSKLRRN